MNQRYQLTRYGSFYASWAFTEQEIKDRECARTNRPWWWLSLFGWGVDFEHQFGPTYQHHL